MRRRPLAGGLNLAHFAVLAAQIPTLPNNQLWLDPYDLSTLSLRSVVNLDGSSGYLLRPGVASDPLDLHGASVTKCSISFWIYFNQLPGDPGGLCLGKLNDAWTNGVWALLISPTNKLRYYEFGNAGAAVNSTDCSTTFQAQKWYYVQFDFDGSAAAASRVSIWIGEAASNTAATSLTQNTIATNSATTNFFQGGNGFNFHIGYGGVNAHLAIRFSDVVVWNRVLSANQRNALWNAGAGVKCTDLGTAGAPPNAPPADYVAAWPMTESSGNRLDLSGGHLDLAPNGATTRVQQVTAWQDKSPFGLLLQAGDGNAGAIGPINLYRAREPKYEPNFFGPGLPAVVVENGLGTGAQGLYCPLAENSWNRFDSGNMFSKTQWLASAPSGQGELFGLVLGCDYRDADASGANTTSDYFLNINHTPGDSVDSAGNKIFASSLRPRGDNGGGSGGTGAIYDFSEASGGVGTFPMIAGNVYLAGTATIPVTKFSEMSCLGPAAGNGLSQGDWYQWLNGQPQAVYVSLGGSFAGWTKMVGHVNYAALGSIHLTQSTKTPNYQRINHANGDSQIAFGPQLMFGPSLNTGQRAAMRSWLINQ